MTSKLKQIVVWSGVQGMVVWDMHSDGEAAVATSKPLHAMNVKTICALNVAR